MYQEDGVSHEVDAPLHSVDNFGPHVARDRVSRYKHHDRYGVEPAREQPIVSDPVWVGQQVRKC